MTKSIVPFCIIPKSPSRIHVSASEQLGNISGGEFEKEANQDQNHRVAYYQCQGVESGNSRSASNVSQTADRSMSDFLHRKIYNYPKLSRCLNEQARMWLIEWTLARSVRIWTILVVFFLMSGASLRLWTDKYAKFFIYSRISNMKAAQNAIRNYRYVKNVSSEICIKLTIVRNTILATEFGRKSIDFWGSSICQFQRGQRGPFII